MWNRMHEVGSDRTEILNHQNSTQKLKIHEWDSALPLPSKWSKFYYFLKFNVQVIIIVLL